MSERQLTLEKLEYEAGFRSESEKRQVSKRVKEQGKRIAEDLDKERTGGFGVIMHD